MAERLVTIAEFPDYFRAELAKQILDDSGIRSAVMGENAANVYSIAALGRVYLQVFEGDEQKALEILQSHKIVEQ